MTAHPTWCDIVGPHRHVTPTARAAIIGLRQVEPRTPHTWSKTDYVVSAVGCLAQMAGALIFAIVIVGLLVGLLLQAVPA